MGRFIAGVQGIYYVATGVWPFLHLESFLAVTGPKTDIWLLYTVSVLIVVIGVALLAVAYSGRISGEILWLAVGSAIALAGIDVVFVLRDVIAEIYLLDAALQALLIAGWGIGAFLHSRTVNERTTGREHVGSSRASIGAS